MSGTQSAITTFWNARSGGYDDQPGHGITGAGEPDAWIRALAEHLPPPPADVLDVGTGTGMLAFLFAQMGYRASGIDLADDMLSQAMQKAAQMPNAPHFRRGDAVEPPFPPHSFDAIASRHVFWTLPSPERALGNWRALLRPGGRLLIIDGLYFSGPSSEPGPAEEQHEAYPADVRAQLPLMSPAATMGDVRALISAAGFTDLRESNLEEVERIERENGYMFSERSPRYVVTAVAP